MDNDGEAGVEAVIAGLQATRRIDNTIMRIGNLFILLTSQ